MTDQILAGVREILAAPDWDRVSVTDYGAFVTISGAFMGTAHAGSRDDWAGLAADLDRIARERRAAAEAEAAARLAPPSPDPAPPLLPDLGAKMSDYGKVGEDAEAEAELQTDDLLTSMRNDAGVAEEVIQKLTKAKRKKFTELLNVELAELQQERHGPREDLKRENEIEALLGLFARVGEM